MTRRICCRSPSRLARVGVPGNVDGHRQSGARRSALLPSAGRAGRPPVSRLLSSPGRRRRRTGGRHRTIIRSVGRARGALSDADMWPASTASLAGDGSGADRASVFDDTRCEFSAATAQTHLATNRRRRSGADHRRRKNEKRNDLETPFTGRLSVGLADWQF